jgi:hypothetical protein
MSFVAHFPALDRSQCSVPPHPLSIAHVIYDFSKEVVLRITGFKFDAVIIDEAGNDDAPNAASTYASF